MKRSLARAAFMLASAVAGLARAQVELDWKAPPECPDGDQVERRVRELAGATPGTPGLPAEAVVERVDNRYRLKIRVVDGDDVRERVIESESCADLGGAAAVALVFLLQDPDAAPAPTGAPSGSEPPPPGSETTPPKAKAEPTTKPSTPREPTQPEYVDEWDPVPSAPRAWAMLVRAPVLGLDIGPLPKPQPNLGAGLGVRYRAVRVVMSAQFGRGQTVAATVPRVGAELERFGGSLSVCRGWESGSWELSPCAVLGVERIDARGVGADVRSRSSGAFWAAPGAEVTLHLRLAEWVALMGGVSTRFQPTRPRIVLDELGEIHQLPLLGVGIMVGTEWIL